MVSSIKDTIYIDVTSDKHTHAVMGHEVSHHMKHDVPAVYADMVKALDKLIKNHEAYALKLDTVGTDKDDII